MNRADGTDAEEAALRVLWAKTGKGGSWHPLICHMIDVAVVARHLWRDVLSPAATRDLAAGLGLEEEDAESWVSFLAGLHDLGKASPSFAILKSKERRPTVEALLPLPAGCNNPPVPHGLITAGVVAEVLQVRGLAKPLALRFATVLGGHHGVLPKRGDVEHEARDCNVGGRMWRGARRALATELARSLGVPSEVHPQALDTPTALVLAGLVSVADWIGSAQELFPPMIDGSGRPSERSLSAYVQRARDQANDALGRLGWLYWPAPIAPRTFSELFPKLDDPKPVQRLVVEVANQLEGPALVLVEVPMGEGKTEAALYLADYWAATLGQRGVYFALPTQATSDQMLTRVREFLSKRFPDQREVLNLQLLHGHAALSAEFVQLRRNADRLFAPDQLHDDGLPAEATGASNSVERRAVAAEWFTYRKRGLLAPFGVGTVDQALLAVLPTAHVFVRLYGLAGRPVVVDEVHAYETYMSLLIERLLEWLAALGSPVVLLSATLPRARAARLLEAYACGLGLDAARTDEPPLAAPALADYPRVSWLSRGSKGSRKVETSDEGRRSLRVEWVDGEVPPEPKTGESPVPFLLCERLKAELANGGCCVVICNTVRRAQAVYRALERYFPGRADDGEPALDLLHSQFPYEERQRREKRALVRFGRKGAKVQIGDGEPTPVRRPDRVVLVATQIVEQSLDVDFDLMVSDFAPVDLLLQRSGRLWRHRQERPAGFAEPTLWVTRPPIGSDGVPRYFQGDTKVYAEHVLLRSWLKLRDRVPEPEGAIAVPDDVAALIEAAYDDRACPADLSSPLVERWRLTGEEHAKEEEDDRTKAVGAWLRSPAWGRDAGEELGAVMGHPRSEDAPTSHPELVALTRLGGPSVEVILLFGPPGSGTAAGVTRASLDSAGDQIVDLTVEPKVPLAKRLLARSVRVGDHRVVHELLGWPVPGAWRRSALLRRHRVVVLEPESGMAAVGRYWLRLDKELGVQVVDPSKA